MGSVGFGVGLFGRWCLRLALALPATGFGFRSPFDGMNDFVTIRGECQKSNVQRCPRCPLRGLVVNPALGPRYLLMKMSVVKVSVAKVSVDEDVCRGQKGRISHVVYSRLLFCYFFINFLHCFRKFQVD